ncbi:hypothetical protein RHCRD62_80036 [Rhodococcus sp. RD6.2]|nr:hypothetical protein RHCRD62_80036 [Rhodococcus sp. RD6.2]
MCFSFGAHYRAGGAACARVLVWLGSAWIKGVRVPENFFRLQIK